MTPHDITLDRAERLERLLREAAAFEPETAAPVGLAQSALAGWNARRGGRSRRPVRALFLGLLGSAGAGAAGATFGLAVTRVAPPAVDAPAGTPVASATAPRPGPALPAVEREGPAEIVQPWSAASMRFAGRAPRAAPGAGRRHAPRWTAPRAVWEVETVERAVAGFSAPAWLVQAGPEPDTLVFTPGDVQTAVPAGVTPEEEPNNDSGSRTEPAPVACEGTTEEKQ